MKKIDLKTKATSDIVSRMQRIDEKQSINIDKNFLQPDNLGIIPIINLEEIKFMKSKIVITNE